AFRRPRPRRRRAGRDRPLRGAHGARAGERRAGDARPRHGRGRVMARAGFTATSSGTIRFGKDGRWYSDGEPIPNRAICRFLRPAYYELLRHAEPDEGGRVVLPVGGRRVPLGERAA